MTVATAETRQTRPNEPGAKRDTCRMASILLIGLGAGVCCSVELIRTVAPQLDALPGLVGSVMALTGLLLLFRCQVRKAKAEAAQKMECLRLAPYVPEMADGSNAGAALAAVLAPIDAPVYEPSRYVAESAQAPLRYTRARKAQRGASATLFQRATGHVATHRANGTPAAFYAALRLGGDWSQDLDLSPRAQARLEADPFVKRLARLS